MKTQIEYRVVYEADDPYPLEAESREHAEKILSPMRKGWIETREVTAWTPTTPEGEKPWWQEQRHDDAPSDYPVESLKYVIAYIEQLEESVARLRRSAAEEDVDSNPTDEHPEGDQRDDDGDDGDGARHSDDYDSAALW